MISASLLLCGCANHRGGSAAFTEFSNTPSPNLSSAKNQLIITPDNQLVGKVTRSNLDGRFVVMTFPIGHLPRMEQRLSVYRNGLKVGDLKVTGPQLDDNVVGDIVAGDARAGDEVRAQ